ncbi:MAG: ATPase, T2SS/T4P/T4SS family [Rhodocyclaceae bacterium]|nr:ATPase, T2SS/T4P/T4SS family [Rhodocyclaceae bacterium]
MPETAAMAAPLVLELEGLRPALSRFVGALLARYGSSLGHLTDVYIASDEPVMARRAAGQWVAVVNEAGAPWIFDSERVRAFVNGIYTGQERPAQTAAWEQALRRLGSLHPATVLSGEVQGQEFAVRVRCSIQRQQMGSALGVVLRVLPQSVPQPEQLGLPAQLGAQIQQISNGLVVVTGPTGSGKSTTLASLLQALNVQRSCHILTIEDPIEYEFERARAVITQREIGVDVPTFAQGVKDALRFVPDVILVGETRDADTMRAVVRAAESGHLVLTSMHAPTTVGCIAKMRALLGDGSADISALAGSLRLIVAQALVHDMHGQGVLIYEQLDARDKVVQSFAYGGAAQDADAIRSKLAMRGLQGAFAWQDRLRELVRQGRLSPQKAALLAQGREEREEFVRLAAQGGAQALTARSVA